MKHVFVETNFLVSLLRPFPSSEAKGLFARNDGTSLRLYIPWCSQAEASRTLTEIIKADLGFTDAMMKFVVQSWLAEPESIDKPHFDKLKKRAELARHDALTTLTDRINSHVAAMVRIDPSLDVVNRTIRVFAKKALKPFDEMVLGAVLAKATELYTAGERELFFCELDRDLAGQHAALNNEYAACGLKVLPNFDVPLLAPRLGRPELHLPTRRRLRRLFTRPPL